MPDLTDAELIKHIAHVRAHNPPYKCRSALALAEYVERSIAARLERPAVSGSATYCGDRLVCINIDVRPGDDCRTMQVVPVKVTITPA